METQTWLSRHNKFISAENAHTQKLFGKIISKK